MEDKFSAHPRKGEDGPGRAGAPLLSQQLPQQSGAVSRSTTEPVVPTAPHGVDTKVGEHRKVLGPSLTQDLKDGIRRLGRTFWNRKDPSVPRPSNAISESVPVSAVRVAGVLPGQPASTLLLDKDGSSTATAEPTAPTTSNLPIPTPKTAVVSTTILHSSLGRAPPVIPPGARVDEHNRHTSSSSLDSSRIHEVQHKASSSAPVVLPSGPVGLGRGGASPAETVMLRPTQPSPGRGPPSPTLSDTLSR